MNSLRGAFQVPLADGTELECLMNLYTLNRFCAANGVKLSEIDKALEEDMLEKLPKLIWAGVETHHALNDTEPQVTQTKFEILFGSTDWPPVVELVGEALNLEPSGQKKAKVK